jgi:hypothetical protein
MDEWPESPAPGEAEAATAPAGTAITVAVIPSSLCPLTPHHAS